VDTDNGEEVTVSTAKFTASEYPEASPRERVAIALDYPLNFIKWCRERVGIVPNHFQPDDGQCVMEQYLSNVAGECPFVTHDYVRVGGLDRRTILTPTWVRLVIHYADKNHPRVTYNDVANMLMLALKRNEIA
jgi:hypothetical protein